MMANYPAASDREVITWASRFWADVRETWWQYREYYRQEFARSHAQSANETPSSARTPDGEEQSEGIGSFVPAS